MIEILVVNDPHVAASPPIGCRQAYVEDVFTLLEEARDIAREREVSCTVFTGDLFHHKRNVPHWVVRRLIELFQRWPGEKLAIAGNHDLGEEGLAGIDRQPLGVLFQSGALKWLKEDYIQFYWKEESGMVTVQWSPANYFDEIDDDPANFSLERYTWNGCKCCPKEVDWAIKVAHGSLVKSAKNFPDGFKVVQYDTVPRDGLDLVLFGHLHHNSGITKVGDTVFASLGSLGRVARTEYNRNREMELLIVQLTKEEMSFERVPLKKAIPADELFIAKDTSEVELDEPMARFARNMEKALFLEEVPVEEVLATVTGKGVEPEVVKTVKKHLVEAGF